MTFVQKLAGAAIAAALAASSAQAIVYNFNLELGAGLATGTITTDGTIGAIGDSNITDWLINLSDGSQNIVLNGTANSQVFAQGNAVTATATGLFFDFSSANGSVLLFQSPFVGAFGINYLCFEDGIGACSNSPSTITMNTGVQNVFERSSVLAGNLQVATAASGAIPEPASWAMLIAGFGLVGAAARRRRQVAVNA